MTAEQPARRAIRLRWWHWTILLILLALALVVSVAFAIRLQGARRYDEAIARLKAAGQPTTVDDLFALAPAMDRRVQDDYAAWRKRVETIAPSHLWPDARQWAQWIVGTAPAPPAGLDMKLAEYAALAGEGRTLLRTGRLVLCAFDGEAHTLPTRVYGWFDHQKLADPHSTSAFFLGLWLRLTATVGADGATALADLDALAIAFSRPACVIDAMIASAAAYTRDQAYLECALRRRLAPEARQRWLVEPSPHLAWAAAGYRGERLLITSVIAADLAAGTAFPSKQPSKQLAFDRAAQVWLYGLEDCAVMTDVEDWAEARLLGRRSGWPNFITTQISTRGVIAQFSIPNGMSGATALESAAQHRLHRLAVRLLLAAWEPAGLPADEADFLRRLGDARALDPGGDALRLRYERLADDRFRLTVDPTTPILDFVKYLDPSWYAKKSAYGKPVASDPLVDGQLTIEIQVPPETPQPTNR